MIEQLLAEIGQDKHENPSTTSDKFKTDLWNWVKGQEWPIDSCAIEYGTHKGQTTKILAHLFQHVYTCNLPGNHGEAKKTNQGSNNITFVEIDLYNSDIYEKITTGKVHLFFIDAVHTHDAVFSDFSRSVAMDFAEPCYFIFDDYGLIPEVKRAVQDLIWVGKLEWVENIGHEPGYDFKNGRVLKDWEGIICKLK